MSCDSIFLNTCAQMYCLCVATQIKRCHQFVQNAAMLIFSLIFVSQRLCCLLFISCSLQESLLCSSCAQIDPVAVTCNESLALSITSVQLDKTLYFRHISPITSNTEKKRKRKKKKKRLIFLCLHYFWCCLVNQSHVPLHIHQHFYQHVEGKVDYLLA